ncbi:MAG: helix-turn-helix domain-containing protein [Pseudomonadota bacterium]
MHAKRHNFTAITSDHGDISKDGISCDWPTEIARQITRYLENCESNTKLDKNYGIYRQILPLFDNPVILYALHKHRYNQVQAAKFLGINRNTLKKRMTELGITIKKSP